MLRDITILQAAELPEKTDLELKEPSHTSAAEGASAIGPFFPIRSADSRQSPSGHAHIDAAMLDRLPAAGDHLSYSAGLAASTSRPACPWVVGRNTSKILAEDVADLALALAFQAAGPHARPTFRARGKVGESAFRSAAR